MLERTEHAPARLMSGLAEMEPLPLDAGRTKGVLSKMRAIWEMVRDAGAAWVDDYASSMGAALSYYTLFSLAPLLLSALGVVDRPARAPPLVRSDSRAGVPAHGVTRRECGHGCLESLVGRCSAGGRSSPNAPMWG